MTDPTAQAPIIVPATAGADQLAAAVRQLGLVLAGLAGMFGYSHLSSQLGQLSVLAALAVGPLSLIYGQIATRRRSNQLTTVAKAAPDSVAVVKS